MKYKRQKGLLVPDDLEQCIHRLEKLSINKTAPIPTSDKEKWEIMIYFHLLSWVCRIAEIAKDMYQLTEAKRFNTALTCGRPLLEAILVFTEHLHKANQAIEDNNDKEISLLFNTVFLKTKNKEFLNTQYKDVFEDPYMETIKTKYLFTDEEYLKYLEALNITTILNSLELDNDNVRKKFFEEFLEKRGRDIVENYNTLGEYTHASAFSTTCHYIEWINDNRRPKNITLNKFGVDLEYLQDLARNCLRYILTFEKAYKSFSEMARPISEKLAQISSKNSF